MPKRRISTRKGGTVRNSNLCSPGVSSERMSETSPVAVSSAISFVPSISATHLDESLVLSQMANDCDVGWDNRLPEATSCGDKDFSACNTEELIRRLGTTTQGVVGDPKTPPLLHLSVESPGSHEGHHRASHQQRNRRLRKRGRPSGIKLAVDSKQIMQRIASALQEKELTYQLKAVQPNEIPKKCLKLCSEPEDNHPQPINKCSQTHSSLPIEPQARDDSFDLFDTTSTTTSDAEIMGCLADGGALSKQDAKEDDDLWLEDDALDDSLIKATQDLLDSGGLATPKALKHWSRTSTPEIAGNRKVGRYTFRLDLSSESHVSVESTDATTTSAPFCSYLKPKSSNEPVSPQLLSSASRFNFKSNHQKTSSSPSIALPTKQEPKPVIFKEPMSIPTGCRPGSIQTHSTTVPHLTAKEDPRQSTVSKQSLPVNPRSQLSMPPVSRTRLELKSTYPSAACQMPTKGQVNHHNGHLTTANQRYSASTNLKTQVSNSNQQQFCSTSRNQQTCSSIDTNFQVCQKTGPKQPGNISSAYSGQQLKPTDRGASLSYHPAGTLQYVSSKVSVLGHGTDVTSHTTSSSHLVSATVASTYPTSITSPVDFDNISDDSLPDDLLASLAVPDDASLAASPISPSPLVSEEADDLPRWSSNEALVDFPVDDGMEDDLEASEVLAMLEEAEIQATQTTSPPSTKTLRSTPSVMTPAPLACLQSIPIRPLLPAIIPSKPVIHNSTKSKPGPPGVGVALPCSTPTVSSTRGSAISSIAGNVNSFVTTSSAMERSLRTQPYSQADIERKRKEALSRRANKLSLKRK